MRSIYLGLLLALCLNPTRADEPPKPKQAPAKANRLAKETSPYLLLHAHNPVDWYPWGPEAFAKAKAENKPIFLSIGYSSCYWCHVMERESFQDAAIAAALNADFVCIKVDREERPDVDGLYMAALQAYSGSGGWPMSMFLFPDGRPFFGGTYFPPHNREEVSGFDSLIKVVAAAWRDKRDVLDRDATNLTDVVKRSVDRTSALGRVDLSAQMIKDGVKELAEQFDPEFGGFGFNPARPSRPKFPEPANLIFLLDDARRTGMTEGLAQVLTTLDRMARGGIRDHLAGGYHRYSTKRDWSVPHFEKMLYDNAQLVSVHVQAFEKTQDPRWRTEAEATLAFVAKSFTSPEGGFYSALDAESEAEEGQSYVWTRDEITKALGTTDAPLFRLIYGLDREPNFEKNRYVLLEPKPRKDVAMEVGLTPADLEAKLVPMRKTLLALRNKRPAPLRDDKILTSWNGLMIAAYADTYRAFKAPEYRLAAERAADFLWKSLRTPDGRLLRTYRNGQAKLASYLEDYAFLAHGLLRLHAATGDSKRLDQAKELTDRMLADFGDTKNGGFFYTAGDHESLLARSKDPFDNAIPGANSVAIRVLVELAAAARDPKYLDHAGKALEAFSGSLSRAPSGSPLMLVALAEYLQARGGKPSSEAAKPAAKPAGVVVARISNVKLDGKLLEIPITLSIKEGYHIYANPAGLEDMIPTTVTLAKPDGAKLIGVTYPKGEVKQLAANGSEKAAVYEKEATIVARVQFDPATDERGGDILLKVRYQACNDKACLAPTTLEVTLKLRREE